MEEWDDRYLDSFFKKRDSQTGVVFVNNRCFHHSCGKRGISPEMCEREEMIQKGHLFFCFLFFVLPLDIKIQ